MSYLHVTAKKLQETEQAILRAEKELTADPRSAVLCWSLESLVKMRRQLESDFSEIANDQQLDVFRYRLFSESEERMSAKALADSLREFQNVFSAVYAATKTGPQSDLRLSKDVKLGSQLHFGYAFTGSFGVVLTVNQQSDLYDTELVVNSVNSLFELARSRTDEQVRTLVSEMGPAPLKAFSTWAKIHADYRIGADISWRRGEARDEIFLTHQEIRRIAKRVQLPSRGNPERVVMRGVFDGASLINRSFQFKTHDGVKLFGRFTDAINREEGVSIGSAEYEVVLLKIPVGQPHADETKAEWQLSELREI